eukprot:8682644-Alexandrium_andersonii.AAC.1
MGPTALLEQAQERYASGRPRRPKPLAGLPGPSTAKAKAGGARTLQARHRPRGVRGEQPALPGGGRAGLLPGVAG